jgi:hypothetical protein
MTNSLSSILMELRVGFLSYGLAMFSRLRSSCKKVLALRTSIPEVEVEATVVVEKQWGCS